MTLAGRPTDTGAHSLARYRDEFPIFRGGIYLNTCSLGALGDRTRRRVAEFLDVWQRRGASAWYDVWWGALGELRARYARVVNASPAEIALAPSISVALSAVAEALDYGAVPAWSSRPSISRRSPISGWRSGRGAWSWWWLRAPTGSPCRSRRSRGPWTSGRPSWPPRTCTSRVARSRTSRRSPRSPTGVARWHWSTPTNPWGSSRWT